MNEPATERLIQQYLDGHTIAIETLIDAYQHIVYRLAFSILNDAAEADEATQDTFVAVLGALASYRHDSAFSTWLYAVTVNVCRGRLRKRRSRERLQQVLQALFHTVDRDSVSLETTAILNETDTAVREAVQDLDEKQRLPIILRYEHELPIAEIAQVLGVSERTVHTRLRTAHEHLRTALNGLLG